MPPCLLRHLKDAVLVKLIFIRVMKVVVDHNLYGTKYPQSR